MENTKEIQMRKKNMKLFSIYKALSWDYIFFYTINFLFLVQVKNINPADVVLIDSFYYLFAMFAQLPATFLIEWLGRKNSIILGNIFGCIYMLFILFSHHLVDLIIAEMLSAIAFAIKDSAEPSLLNESIPPTAQKSKIFSKISGKGMSHYYIINGISTIIAGIIYEINPYIPIMLSLTTLIIVTLLATLFIEPVKNCQKEKIKRIGQFQELKESFKFVLKSERVKSLILYAGIMTGLFSILSNYEITMLEELELPASFLGILFAILQMTSAMTTKKQEKVHQTLKNRSLITIGFVVIGSCLFSGITGIIAKEFKIGILAIILCYWIKYMCSGIYEPLVERYLSNFTNEKIDTKIYTANNFFCSITSAIIGILAAFLLERIDIAYCMIIVGIIFLLLIIFIMKFMKTRVGLAPEQYSKEEVKYDKIKQTT